MRRIFAFLCVLLAGCIGAIRPPDQPVASGLTGGNARSVQLLMPFQDRRAEPARCGMLKNTYNMEVRNITCETPPAQFLAELLATELKAAGFNVVTSALPDSQTVVLEGSLLQFFLEPDVSPFYIAPEADIHVLLVARSASGLAASRDFYVKGTDASFFVTGSNYQTASNRAVKEIVTNMVAAVSQLMNRFPPLGAPPASRL